MKRIIIALLACLPMTGMAQNTWEVPQEDTRQTQSQQKKKALFETHKKVEDPKYLAGAVPEVDGRIVFTLDKDVPGMGADEIYQKTFDALQALVKEPDQFPTSKIAAVNKDEHTIAARFKEWLVFQNTFLSLDRTIFLYTLIVKATDGHLKVTMERLGYQYEKEREDTNGGLDTKAEEWISDQVALNKKKDKLNKFCAKFRRKTIDRKDHLFDYLCKAVGVAY